MSNMQIAQTILEQLGGKRFIIMTGAKNLGAGENYLSFKIGRNPKGVTHVKITLTPMDLYDMEFFKVRGTSFKKVSEIDGVYFDQLQDIFTDRTGLYTSL